MSRYREPGGPLDEHSAGEGDAEWRGVDALNDPDKVAPGFATVAENITFSTRSAATRAGSYMPAGFRHAQLAPPFYGSGVFSDPDGVEFLLVAAGSKIWRLRDGYTPRRIEIPEAAITAPVEFVQAFNRMFVFRGAERTPWTWEGSVKAGAGFYPINQVDPADGTTKPIPNGPERPGLRPVLLNQRLFVPHGKRELAASDLLDYTRYDDAFYNFNLAGAGDDRVTGLFPFSGASMLVFNDQSVQILDGLSASLQSARLSPVNKQLGTEAGGTIAQVGADVFFANTAGVWRVSQVVESRLATAPDAVSEPIESIIKRINPAAFPTACAAMHGRYYHLAVPLDGAAYNNAVLRYDTVAKAWQGIDRYPAGVQVSALHVTDFRKAKRLYAVDYVNGRVHLLEHGRFDKILAAVYQIPTKLRTRAYLIRENQPKRFARGSVDLRGWAPSYSIRTFTGGVNEGRTELGGEARTPSRGKWKVWGKADYAQSNVNGDHAAADREDYSVDPATPFDPDPSGGIDFDLEQTRREPFTVRRTDRSLQIEISNTTGALAVISTQIDADPAQRTLRPT